MKLQAAAMLRERDLDAEREAAVEEARQLIVDLRDATQDGRQLAKRYAEVLQGVVDEYCVEFEARARAVLEKLEALA